MRPVTPDPVDGLTAIVFAKNQEQYEPLPANVGTGPENYGEVTTEWELSTAEIQAIPFGGRVRLTVCTFGRPLQPLRLEVVTPLGEVVK